MVQTVVWSKTILTAYPNLEQYAARLDKSMQALACKGLGHSGDPMELIGKMMQLNVRKETVVNVYVIVTQTLEKVKPQYREILECKYGRGMRFAQIAEHLQVCLRTVFRRYQCAMEQFVQALERSGYGAQWLGERLGDDPMFAKLHDRVQERMLSEEAPYPADGSAQTLEQVMRDIRSVVREKRQATQPIRIQAGA